MPEREDMIRSGSLAFRRRLPPMIEPAYSMSEVERAHKDLVGSEVTRVDGRIDWLPFLAEMLLLCNEASRRQYGRGLSPTGNKPLSLEYLADRLDTDDPLWGLTVRSSQDVAKPMQGFITLTTFTTWVRWFRWDSSAELAAINEFPKDLSKTGRVIDSSNELASMLEATVRDGDPEGEGVIWPHIAEISLLGGLGCGKALLQMAIEELESSDSAYDFVVLQATENAVAFYESQGFTRVGAVARYQDLDPELMERKRQAERAEMLASVSQHIITILDHLEGVQENGEASEAVESDISCFSELPPKSLPGYYSVIKNPISFQEIRIKAKAQEYESLLGRMGVERDLKLMCDNAKRFNAVGSAVWLAAEDLERSAMVKLDPNSGNTTFSSSESLDLVPLPQELQKASAPDALWRAIKPDMLIDCQDSKRGHWLKAKVVDIDDLGQCLVHFQGWAKKWDEWYAVDSEHIAKAGTYTDQAAPEVDEIIPQQDEKSILKATAFRVKPSVTLAVTAGVQVSSKRLGTLPSGMVVFVTDKHVNAKGIVERLFFEQATNSSVPAKGWVSLRRQSAKGGMEMLLDPVKAKGAPIDVAPPPTTKNNTRRRRGRNHNGESQVEVKPMLGAGAIAGCTECRWHLCRPDETPAAIAAHVGCQPFDVVFLNKHLYMGLTQTSRLRGGTKLRVPISQSITKSIEQESSKREKRWYDAKENETPRMIAAHFPGTNVADLIAMNAKRFPDLQPSSRLRKGTRVRLPRPRSEGVATADELYRESCLAWEDDPEVVAYRHWTFPDDENIEDTSASYMMARKLVRRKRGVPGEMTQRVKDCAQNALLAASSAKPVSGDENGSRTLRLQSSTLSQREGAPVAVMEAVIDAIKDMKDETDRRRCELFLDLPPKKHFADYYLLIKEPICLNHISKRIADTEAAKHRSRGSGWGEHGYTTITEFSNDLQKLFDNARSYNLPGSEVYMDAEEMEVLARETLARLMGEHDAKGDLFNKVVSVSAARDGSTLPYDLYFVLTYIPDLQWCRLGPLEVRGNFKKGSPYAGQQRWMLVHGEESEADVSASRCTVVRARAAKRTEDADFEEWVIPETEKGKLKTTSQQKSSLKSASLPPASNTNKKIVPTLLVPPEEAINLKLPAHVKPPSPPTSPSVSSVISSGSPIHLAISPLESVEIYGGVDLKPSRKSITSRSLSKFDYVTKVSGDLVLSSVPSKIDEPEKISKEKKTKSGMLNKRVYEEGETKLNGKRKVTPNDLKTDKKVKKRNHVADRETNEETEEEDESGSESEEEISRPKSKRRKSAMTVAVPAPQPKAAFKQKTPPTLEELLTTSPPRSVADQKSWGRSFIKVSMSVPAAVFGAEYAKSARALWNLTEQTCEVTRFRPGKFLNQHRWEFNWVDPESTALGTVDFKNMCKYARKAFQESRSSIAKSRPRRKAM